MAKHSTSNDPAATGKPKDAHLDLARVADLKLRVRKHTDTQSHTIYAEGLSTPVGTVKHPGPATQAALANLFAAAPELLAAIKPLRDAFFRAVEEGVQIPDFDPGSHVSIRRADAAIAKAEGRQS